MKHRWLIEGVCGTGKSSVLAAMQAHYASLSQSLLLLDEDQTFGELMSELADAKANLCWRLDKCLEHLQEQLDAYDVCILERFHPSYFAQIPQMEMYTQYDRALYELGFKLILLELPDSELKQRSLYRYEREAEHWIDGNIAFYGSEALAVEAFRVSQQRRRDFLTLTRLSYQVVDTQSQQWSHILDEILNPHR